MSAFDLQRVPSLRPGYRLQWEPAQQGHVLLYPEGMIKLNESAAIITALIDGRSDVAAIIQQLSTRYPDALELAEDVVYFMEIACEQFWIQLA